MLVGGRFFPDSFRFPRAQTRPVYPAGRNVIVKSNAVGRLFSGGQALRLGAFSARSLSNASHLPSVGRRAAVNLFVHAKRMGQKGNLDDYIGF